MAKQKTLDFEASLEHLEELIEQLESGELSLEESLKTFEQGIKLTRQCQQALKAAEQKVAVLMKQDDGEMTETSFEATTDE
ncbi:exodeoxyribonuclease VII small subunit [Alteromonadaceae bacterium 2753L.S.0a.02]|nr:exodeoxyribonuclease VII small subunit [Alteromonadaceae bacterium 2753L.S.0a.02]